MITLHIRLLNDVVVSYSYLRCPLSDSETFNILISIFFEFSWQKHHQTKTKTLKHHPSRRYYMTKNIKLEIYKNQEWALRNKPLETNQIETSICFSKDYNQPRPIIQGNIPLSTPAHVETAHAKLKKSFYKNSPAQRLIRSKIVPEPSANKTCTSVTWSWWIIAAMM